MDWVVENHIKESSPESALQKRQSIQNKTERARHLYINGDLDWKGFSRIKEEAEAALVSIYVPEFDDAVEAGKVLSDCGKLWEGSAVGRRNRLLRSMLQAIYVDLDDRQLIGLLPKNTFLAPLLGMAERSDVCVLDASKGHLGRNGGDGGGPEPRFPTIPILVRSSVGFNDARSSDTETGFWIREKRLALGISQLQRVSRVGVHEKTVQAWENGASSPRPYNRQLLEIQLTSHPQ